MKLSHYSKKWNLPLRRWDIFVNLCSPWTPWEGGGYFLPWRQGEGAGGWNQVEEGCCIWDRCCLVLKEIRTLTNHYDILLQAMAAATSNTARKVSPHQRKWKTSHRRRMLCDRNFKIRKYPTDATSAISLIQCSWYQQYIYKLLT